MHDAPHIDFEAYFHVVFLTGAGISVASVIRPYRGPGGLWNDETLVKFSDIETFWSRPGEVWDFWRKTREVVLAARPNPAHLSLARLEGSRPVGSSFTLITQNIDGLHLSAGSGEVVEYHGNVMRTRCSNEGCDLEPFRDEAVSGDLPLCPRCGAVLRPDIVMFGEAIPAEARRRAAEALRSCDLFVAVGSSGTVYPASTFVDEAKSAGARTIYVNLQPLDSLGGRGAFDEEYLGKAEELLPRMLAIRP
jgi:NAD-dependent deacetylase